jgi:carboxyl-terminal processing protease
MSRRNRLVLAAAAVLVLSGFGGSQGAPQDDLKDEAMELYGVFVDAVEQVESNYVRNVPRKQLLESALRGMLEELDPHSSYFTEAEWTQFRKQIEGSFTGIGVSIEIDPETRRLKVLAPLPGSPAYAAGILPGDTILEVDGKSTEGLSRDQSVEALQGRPGTSVTLSILHRNADKPVDITLTRTVIELPSVLGDTRKPDDSWDFMLDKEHKIGYVRISNFVQDTAEDVKKALDQLRDEGMKALVLDLRDDPGGLLSAAVEVSDLFLTDGKIVTTKGRNQRDRVYEAEEEGTYGDFPMAVLVNNHSASASEIVAAALQDHGRAVVVGQRSFGKGSVQNVLPLDNGQSILKLTVATYWRPSGKNIHRFPESKADGEWGVAPDEGMEVKLTPEEYRSWAEARRRRDQISRLNPEAPRPDAAAMKDDKPTPDKQLDKALEALRAKLAEEATKAPNAAG